LHTKEEVYDNLKLRLEEASMGYDALKTALELNS